MDPVTHILSGVLWSRTALGARAGRAALIVTAVAAELPDIDYLTLRFAGPLAYLKYHRGFTHSLAGSLVVVPLYALTARFLLARLPPGSAAVPSLASVTALAFTGYYTHMALDVITSYGTELLYPLSGRRYALDLVFIIDPILTAVIVAGIWAGRRAGPRAAALFVALAVSYLVFVHSVKEAAMAAAAAALDDRGVEAELLDAVPMPLSPFRWSVFFDGGDEFLQVKVDEARGTAAVERFGKEGFSGMDEGEFRSLMAGVRSLDVAGVYLRFARHPIVRAFRRGEGYEVEYYDLRFNLVEGRRPFLLRLRLDGRRELRDVVLTFHTLKAEGED
ncbi:MAG TPA: metal-dependent hydrolase [Deltaproteobacteria bacterium]|nr:metal-dependent hydrolase [Deltaproteobacteria bacterium]